MKVSTIKNISFSANNTQEKKSDFLSSFHEKARNQADMTDTVVVPRTIFTGYLGFMAGTTLTSIGALLKNHPRTSKTLNIAGLLTCLYGTYSFVRPFIIKDTKGVDTTKSA